jgi:hypothetical protein
MAMDAIEDDVRYQELVRKGQAGELSDDEASELARLLAAREEANPLADDDLHADDNPGEEPAPLT